MNGDEGSKLFRIETKGANPVLRKTLSLTRGWVEHSLRLDGIEKIYRDSKAQAGDAPFSEKILRAMNVRMEVSDADVARIPVEGPVVVVANHPFGGVEGIVLLALLERVRPDFRIMANFMLGRIPELRESFIFVDPFGAPKSVRSNIRPLKQCIGWLKQGGILATFPAGEVSSVDLRTGKVRDPAWMPATGSLVRHSGAVVVPVFFSGHNGPLFQLAGLVHPRFRTLMLPRQVLNKRNHSIRLQIGSPISPREMSDFSDDKSLTNYLRLRTYVLAGRETASTPRPKFLPRRKAPAPPPARLEPVAEAVDPGELQAEINALGEGGKLLSSAEYEVYAVEGKRIPALLREIGRLREITFRGVGEGTGQAVDLDRFDTGYLHLFIWNREKSEIVGAYRLGPVDVILREAGIRGLYTSTLFRFNDKLLNSLHPAMELGRSFVRPEYQKAYASLLLLWKGIGAYLARHPRYRTLFGPVSITNEYRVFSRNLLLRSLRLSNFAPEMARFVKPRKRPRQGVWAEWKHPDFNSFFKDIEQVSAMIQDIEQDRKGVPILVRQYLKLGGKILAFNLDPAFSSVVDALIAINLDETAPKTLSRYMGRENAATFLAARPPEKAVQEPGKTTADARRKRGRPRKPSA